MNLPVGYAAVLCIIANAPSACASGDSGQCGASLIQKQQHRSRSTLSNEPAHGGKATTWDALPETVLGQMIVSNPWKCDLLPEWDIYRRPTCNMPFSESGLHPAHRSELGNSSSDHKSSIRMLFPIGSLPCCSTMPFCSAPACQAEQISAVSTLQLDEKSCTKHTANENFAYMTSPEVWPIYHGWGGSYDLDVQKHYDILHTALHQEGRFEPFDLVIDVGANSGVITEKLTARNFARNYILVEAYPGMKTFFESRFGNADWKQRWLSEQVPSRKETQVPELEFLNFAVNSKSEGSVDFCTNNMWSVVNNNVPCPVDKMALDDMIPGRLSDKFSGVFAAAESAYVKTDVEGMDELALRGMSRLFQEQRGKYKDGAPRYLVNFLQLEYSPILANEWKDKERLPNYDLNTVTAFLESVGFETFLMGPRYLPLSHGSWDNSFKEFMEDPENSFGGPHFPVFSQMACPGPECPDKLTGPLRNVVAADLFAIRASHPMAAKIKRALGSCKESQDFYYEDEHYAKA